MVETYTVVFGCVPLPIPQAAVHPVAPCDVLLVRVCVSYVGPRSGSTTKT